MAIAELVAGPKINSRALSAKCARSLSRDKLYRQLHQPQMPIRRIENPGLAVPTQIEYLSGFIPFHGSALENAHEVDIGKIPAAFLKDRWELGSELVRSMNILTEEETWYMVHFPIYVGGQIQVIPCISGRGMMEDYRNIQLYAAHKWWSLNADHPAKEAEMEISFWYEIDITVMNWITRVLSKYPKCYVVIKDAASDRSAAYFDYEGLDCRRPFKGSQQWLEVMSWGLTVGAKLRFEIKGPYADKEFEELREVFLKPHQWHSNS